MSDSLFYLIYYFFIIYVLVFDQYLSDFGDMGNCLTPQIARKQKKALWLERHSQHLFCPLLKACGA